MNNWRKKFNKTYKIIFAGTPEFARAALQAIIDTGHQVSLVLTKPDAVSGRGNSVKPSAVKQLANKYNVPILQPTHLKSEDVYEVLKSQEADFMIVAAYGLIIPKRILEIPKYGCLNIHGSLLPRWRGAAPIQRAILAGDKQTGITIIQMDAGLDTGDMLLKSKIDIEKEDTTGTMYEKMAQTGAKTIVDTLNQYENLTHEKQDDSLSCYAEKLSKSEALINWYLDAEEIERNVRGYNPFPGAYTIIDDKICRIFKADIIENIEENIETALPGTIIVANKKQLIIACGKNALSVQELQLPGSKKMNVQAFLSGYKLETGKKL